MSSNSIWFTKDKSKSFHRLKINNETKLCCFFSQNVIHTKCPVWFQNFHSRNGWFNMSRTPLFHKESTPQDTLIPHVNNKMLSCLLVTGDEGAPAQAQRIRSHRPHPPSEGPWVSPWSSAEHQAGRRQRSPALLPVALWQSWAVGSPYHRAVAVRYCPPPPPLPGNGYHETINSLALPLVGAAAGRLLRGRTVTERPSAVLLSHWSVAVGPSPKQPAVSGRPLVGGAAGGPQSGGRRGEGGWGERRIPAFSRRPSAYPALGHRASGTPRGGRGLSCRAPDPSASSEPLPGPHLCDLMTVQSA